MFLVSNVDMVVSISEAGGVGTFPALNFRPKDNYLTALKTIKKRTSKPIGVNIIVNQSNRRQTDDLRGALDHGVELIITSLGNPREVIKAAHQNGTKVFCDVTNLEHALKVEDLGADGLIAVSAGAGGHAGPISPLVLIPWLKSRIKIPLIAAGGVANGTTLAACLALGASGVSIGTRFIASTEAQVDPQYKKAILESTPEDIVLTSRISGTPAAVINTPFIQKQGLSLTPWLQLLKSQSWSKKWITSLIHALGMNALETAATQPTWKQVWSAGQSVGLVNDIKSCQEIIHQIINEYQKAVKNIPPLRV